MWTFLGELIQNLSKERVVNEWNCEWATTGMISNMKKSVGWSSLTLSPFNPATPSSPRRPGGPWVPSSPEIPRSPSSPSAPWKHTGTEKQQERFAGLAFLEPPGQNIIMTRCMTGGWCSKLQSTRTFWTLAWLVQFSSTKIETLIDLSMPKNFPAT